MKERKIRENENRMLYLTKAKWVFWICREYVGYVYIENRETKAEESSRATEWSGKILALGEA